MIVVPASRHRNHIREHQQYCRPDRSVRRVVAGSLRRHSTKIHPTRSATVVGVQLPAACPKVCSTSLPFGRTQPRSDSSEATVPFLCSVRSARSPAKKRPKKMTRQRTGRTDRQCLLARTVRPSYRDHTPQRGVRCFAPMTPRLASSLGKRDQRPDHMSKRAILTPLVGSVLYMDRPNRWRTQKTEWMDGWLLLRGRGMDTDIFRF